MYNIFVLSFFPLIFRPVALLNEVSKEMYEHGKRLWVLMLWNLLMSFIKKTLKYHIEVTQEKKNSKPYEIPSQHYQFKWNNKTVLKFFFSYSAGFLTDPVREAKRHCTISQSDQRILKSLFNPFVSKASVICFTHIIKESEILFAMLATTT